MWRTVVSAVMVLGVLTAGMALADDEDYMTDSGEIGEVSDGEIMTDSGELEEVGDDGEYMTDSGEMRETSSI